MALTCALAPAYAIRWHIGFYPTTVLENAILITLVVFAWESRSVWRSLSWRSPFLLPALLFLVAGAIAVVTAPGRLAGLGLYRAYLIEPMAFAFALANVVRTPGRALFVVSGLFAGAGVAGLANSIVVTNALLHHTYQVTQSPPVVIYLTANAVALYVVPLVAVAGSLALYGRRLERQIGIAFLAIGLVITVMSFSRGGYLALAAVVFALAMSHRRRLPLLGLAFVVLLALALVPPVRQRVLIETQNVYGNTIQSRLDLWSATINLLRARPILGAGLAGFPQRIVPYFSHLHTQANFIDPHNIVFNFWVETGLLGLLAMAWIISVGFAASWAGWRRGAVGWRPYHLGVMLALVAVIVHGMVDVPYFKNDLSLEFWVLLSVTWAGRLWGDQDSAAPVARGS